MKEFIIVDDKFKVPKKIYLELTEVHGLTSLEAMFVILENI